MDDAHSLARDLPAGDAGRSPTRALPSLARNPRTRASQLSSAIVVLLLIRSVVEPTSLGATVAGTTSGASYTTSTDTTAVQFARPECVRMLAAAADRGSGRQRCTMFSLRLNPRRGTLHRLQISAAVGVKIQMIVT